MEALNRKRERLRYELQDAYDAWLSTSEDPAIPTRPPVDVSGCRDESKRAWFDYLAAKERLVLAYAEQSSAA
jgi:hypothetical protein